MMMPRPARVTEACLRLGYALIFAVGGPAGATGAVAMVTDVATLARPSFRSSVSGLLLLAGAGVYALSQGVVGVAFAATPLTIGVAALAAGLAGPRRHLLPVGLALAGWGAGVLLAAEIDGLGDRTTALHVVGFGARLCLVRAVAPAYQRGSWLNSASISVLVSGLSFLLAFDMDQLGRWPAWTAAMVLWGLWEMRPSPEQVEQVEPDLSSP